jgi:CheY-like chemotaxis protein
MWKRSGQIIELILSFTVFRFFVQVRTVAPLSPIGAMINATASDILIRPSINPISTDSQSGTATPASTMSMVSSVNSFNTVTASSEAEELHILIVEDNIINQTVLKRQMIKAGLTCDGEWEPLNHPDRVSVANNGLEALNLIREADRQSRRGGVARRKLYNVVLMDLEMPGQSYARSHKQITNTDISLISVMDGLTAVREIRSAEAAGTLGRTMVIALTGNARQGQIDQAIEAGMDEGELGGAGNDRLWRRLPVVIKPYVLTHLIQRIRAMSQKKIDLQLAALAAMW